MVRELRHAEEGVTKICMENELREGGSPETAENKFKLRNLWTLPKLHH